MEIFQPGLQLVIEPDGEYTLHAVTITPNSAYAAGRACHGVPPGVRLTPETYPVLLQIRSRGGRARHVLTPVRHHLRNMKLGAKHGKAHLIAFAMVGDRVVGSSTIAVHPTHEGPKDPVAVDTSDWYAWVDRMPPGPATFHITCLVHLPSPGYDARLVPASPQGINPTELMLDLEVTPRPGHWPQVVTAISVRYDAPATAAYRGVLIKEPDGDAFHVDVDQTQ